MREVDANLRVCPHCGYDADAPQHAPYLAKRSVLDGRYLIGKLTGIEADSALYIGQNLSSGETVVVREFLPESLIQRTEGQTALEIRMGCESLYRQLMGSFESLWRAIMGLENSAELPQVEDLIFCNGTVYAVTKYLDAITLRAYIEMPGKRLNWPGTIKSFQNVMIALIRLHGIGVIHAAITPNNLFVGADGKLHLDGFTIPQTKEGAGPLKSPAADGFAPLERYDTRMHLGPSTDVYSLAASMLFGMTGQIPQRAADRAVQDHLTLPPAVTTEMPPSAAKALLSALQLYPQRRFHSMEQFLNALAPVAPQKPQNDPPPEPKPPAAAQTKIPAPPKPIPVSGEGDAVTVLVPEKKVSTPLWLAAKVFLIVVASGVLLFTGLYATTLYRYIDAPLLDRIFSVAPFLPVTKNAQPTTFPQPSTQPPQEDVEVPDFLILNASSIKGNRTFNKHFDLVYEYEENAEVPKDAILSQSIPAGARVPQGTRITITVSTGPAMVTLKDVFGYTYSDAVSILEADGFRVRRSVRTNDGTHNADEVCEMSLVAQLEYEKGTEVTLTVWGVYVPPPTTTEPPTEITVPTIVESTDGDDGSLLDAIMDVLF